MNSRRLLDNLDLPSILTTLALVGIGLLSIASATLEKNPGMWRVQLLWLAVASVAAAVVFMVDYRIWAELALALHVQVNQL